MSIVNINYHAKLIKQLPPHYFQNKRPPQQVILPCAHNGRLVIFKSGKCRIMGCKSPLTDVTSLPLPLVVTRIQSITVKLELGKTINLRELANTLGSHNCTYEPEIFPALRLTKDFLPLCVNVFASGKIIILGIKTLDIQPYCHKVTTYLNNFL